MQDKLISIGDAAQKLGISIDTLRRWDKAGRLKATRVGSSSHRYYLESDLAQFLQNIEVLGKNWAQSQTPYEPQPESYCSNRDIFQARLENFESKLGRVISINTTALLTAIAGEIGNNSFDHNLGNWPDIPGVYFTYSMRTRKIVLADRGLGILATLKRVLPNLKKDEKALQVAFTETISGRYPEARGNGLKFVRSIVQKNPFILFFQSGNAFLNLEQNEQNIVIQKQNTSIRGCLAIIEFEKAL